MQISKKSWHYRFNSNLQGDSFRDRALGRKFTTCTYIRTTIRSFLMGVFYLAMLFIAAVVLLFLIFNMFYVPIAVMFGLTIKAGMVVPCVVGWTWVLLITAGCLFKKYGGKLRAMFSERQEKKLSLLEQRIKDGKEGVCTIVEVV